MIPISRTYIDLAKVADEVQFSWDDDNPRAAYVRESAKLMHKVGEISRRGKVGVSAGIVEWIAWRLSRHADSRILFLLADALWASTADWRYIVALDAPERRLEWRDWKGPVRGPICGTYQLIETIVTDSKRGMATEPWIVSLSNLAEYVLTKPAPFKAWRRNAIERLGKLDPWSRQNPVGSPVPPEAVDPDFDYLPDQGTALMTNFLRTLDYSANPFLRPPEQMIKDGFEGTPYAS
jgi:hypothetical protein